MQHSQPTTRAVWLVYALAIIITATTTTLLFHILLTYGAAISNAYLQVFQQTMSEPVFLPLWCVWRECGCLENPNSHIQTPKFPLDTPLISVRVLESRRVRPIEPLTQHQPTALLAIG